MSGVWFPNLSLIEEDEPLVTSSIDRYLLLLIKVLNMKGASRLFYLMMSGEVMEYIKNQIEVL
jgi:hypothetical protein